MVANVPGYVGRTGLGTQGVTVYELYDITLTMPNGTTTLVSVKNGADLAFDSRTYEGIGLAFSGYKRNSDGSAVRPSLKLFNPAGIFNTFAFQGVFEGAIVARTIITQDQVGSTYPCGEKQIWRVSAIKSLVTNQAVDLELRTMTDIPNQPIPARLYTPPTFPFVNLS